MLAFGMPGGLEWVVIVVIGLLIFGRRLPDVARNLGKSIVEFKRGIKDVRHDIDTGTSQIEPPQTGRLEQTPPGNPPNPPVSTDSTEPKPADRAGA